MDWQGGEECWKGEPRALRGLAAAGVMGERGRRQRGKREAGDESTWAGPLRTCRRCVVEGELCVCGGSVWQLHAAAMERSPHAQRCWGAMQVVGRRCCAMDIYLRA